MAVPSISQGSGVLARPAKVRLDVEAPCPHPAYGRGPQGTCWGSSPTHKSKAVLVCWDPIAGSVWHTSAHALTPKDM